MIYRLNLNNISETGRFGNQLWAIASTIGIANKNNTSHYFPSWEYQSYFMFPLPHLDVDAWKKVPRIYVEPDSYYHDVWLDNKYDWELRGYFQSWKYFKDCEINYQFETDIFDAKNVDYNTCAVHVRRGDYLNLQHTHPVLDKSYYEKAMDMFPRDTHFTFFSDDINWCVENFKYHNPGYINFKMIGDDVVDWIEMTKKYRHIIIANSSYSWWAAYLKPFEDKIIVAPRIWVLNEDSDDRVPEEWIRL